MISSGKVSRLYMTASEDEKQPASWPWLKKYPPGVAWDAPLVPRSVHEILFETALKFPDRPAFDFLGKKFSWTEIAGLVNQTARGLQQMGVQKDTRVGLFLPNSPAYLIFYYAVLRAGGIVVNFNPLYPPRELEHQIKDSGTDILVTFDLKMLCDKVQPILKNTALKTVVVCRFTDMLPFPKNVLFKLFKGRELARPDYPGQLVWFHNLIANDGNPATIAIDPLKDIAVLQYTGGTTGVPKGAMLTHAKITANVEQATLWFSGARHGEEKMLGVLPFFHVFAMTAVLGMAVRCGFEIIALPRFDLEDTLKIIQKKKPEYFPAVPAIYNAINHHPKLDKYDLTSLRYCISGGAALPVEVKKSFEKSTGCVVVEGYGLTESSPVVCINPPEGDNKAGSIGLPVPGTIVEIISTEDRKTPVPFGERGELCVRGPQVMAGYWNKPGETADTMMHGRLHTGDIAIMDAEGYIYIVDRIKDMVITNGYNVYPRNVEEAIYLHPGVEECIVAGVPDPARGEMVKAWIKIKRGQDVNVDDLKAFLKDKLSPMEIPREIEFRSTPLPKTMIGKLSRKDLLEQEGIRRK